MLKRRIFWDEEEGGFGGGFRHRVFGEGSWRAYGAACIVEVEARVASLW
mgnify:CR=1 FL=1